MSAEERWADRMEWAEEKRRGFDVEIKSTRPLSLDDFAEVRVCAVKSCHDTPDLWVGVGRVEYRGGVEFPMCKAHADDDDAPFKLWEESRDPNA